MTFQFDSCFDKWLTLYSIKDSKFKKQIYGLITILHRNNNFNLSIVLIVVWRIFSLKHQIIGNGNTVSDWFPIQRVGKYWFSEASPRTMATVNRVVVFLQTSDWISWVQRAISLTLFICLLKTERKWTIIVSRVGYQMCLFEFPGSMLFRNELLVDFLASLSM